MQPRSSIIPRGSVIFTLELSPQNPKISTDTPQKLTEGAKSKEEEKKKDTDKEKPNEKEPEKIAFKLNSPYLKEVCKLLGYNFEDLKKKYINYFFYLLMNNYLDHLIFSKKNTRIYRQNYYKSNTLYM